MIEASAIAPAVAAARGYFSALQKTDLASLGFSMGQRRVPALVVPLHGASGGVVAHQIRPDAPRERNGKALKYETPAGARNVIDVPPGARPSIGNPAVPLWITEGARKADAAVSAGACCIALSGVWNWRGTNAAGGKTALPDWDEIALNGRQVLIAYDSDSATNPDVRHAEEQLSRFLVHRQAQVRVLRIPPAPDGGKQGLDDYLAAGGTLEALTAATPAPAPPAPAKPNKEGDALPPQFSESALTLDFVDRAAGRFLYVAEWARWLRWTGTVWEHDVERRALDEVHKLCCTAAASLEAYLSAEGRPVGRARSLAGWRTVRAVEQLAATDPRMTARAEEFDANPWALNTPGGIVNLQTGEMAPHDPGARCSKITAATPGGEAPRWHRFLDEATVGDTELQAFLQRWAGYSLTGTTTEHALAFIYGPAAAGKSRFAEALRFAWGSYGMTAPMDLLLSSTHDRHPAELARLQGARLVTAAETSGTRSWDESRVKALTGGDRVAARFMRADFFEFDPQCKLLITGNYRPRMSNADDAMRRRFNVVPFEHTVPEGQRDQGLAEALEAEAGGILAWAVEGALDWRHDGLRQPRAVQNATAGYFEAEDVIGRFLADRCAMIAGWTPTGALWNAWEDWCNAEGEAPGSKRRLADALQRHGAIPERRDAGRGYAGIRLKPSWAGKNSVSYQPHDAS